MVFTEILEIESPAMATAGDGDELLELPQLNGQDVLKLHKHANLYAENKVWMVVFHLGLTTFFFFFEEFDTPHFSATNFVHRMSTLPKIVSRVASLSMLCCVGSFRKRKKSEKTS